ncbi:hypothetical protein PQX77_013647 [Marasmius sp. AFHP31]|nr:hypothetical protein PQX77_013647 [Marasmius sp. AFHP31]
MLWHKSISAWVESEGRRLPQYKATERWPERPDSRDGDYPTISCWIPSELGQTFEICFTDDDLQSSICGYVEIDGTKCGSKFLRAPMDNGKVMRKDGVRTSETEMSYFQFADVVTTDKLRADGIVPPLETPVKVEKKNDEVPKADFIDLTVDDNPPIPKERVFIDLTIDGDVNLGVLQVQLKDESEKEIILVLDDEEEPEPILQIFQ